MPNPALRGANQESRKAGTSEREWGTQASGKEGVPESSGARKRVSPNRACLALPCAGASVRLPFLFSCVPDSPPCLPRSSRRFEFASPFLLLVSSFVFVMARKQDSSPARAVVRLGVVGIGSMGRGDAVSILAGAIPRLRDTPEKALRRIEVQKESRERTRRHWISESRSTGERGAGGRPTKTRRDRTSHDTTGAANASGTGQALVISGSRSQSSADGA